MAQDNKVTKFRYLINLVQDKLKKEGQFKTTDEPQAKDYARAGSDEIGPALRLIVPQVLNKEKKDEYLVDMFGKTSVNSLKKAMDSRNKRHTLDIDNRTLMHYFELAKNPDERHVLMEINKKEILIRHKLALYVLFLGWNGFCKEKQITIQMYLKDSHLDIEEILNPKAEEAKKEPEGIESREIRGEENRKIVKKKPTDREILLHKIREGSKNFFDEQFRQHTILDNLLSTWKDDTEIETGVCVNGSKDSFPLISAVENLWKKNIKSSLIVGEGGMGKTFSLLRIWKHYVNNTDLDSPIPIFIILNAYNTGEDDKKSFIIKYVAKNYLNIRNLDDKLENELWALFSLNTDIIKPKFIFLLDGFNEIYKDQVNLRLDLDNWWLSKTNAVQIIITSRYDIRLNCMWQYLHLIRLLPLPNDTIRKYLDQHQIEFGNKKIPWELLNNPMMLTLFTSTSAIINRYGKYPFFEFIENYSSQGELLWNYFECQLTTYLETHKYDEQQFFYWMFLLKVITPFLGYEMERLGFYNISENALAELINKGSRTFFNENFTKAFPKYRKYFKYFKLGKLSFEDEDERIEIIKEILIEKLRIIVKHDESYRFSHQNFRDFTAAIHVINDIRISSITNTVTISMRDRTLPTYIRKYLGEIKGEHYYKNKDQTEIVSLLSTVKGNFNENETGYFVWNVIETLNDFRSSLGMIDFGDLDLSQVEMNGKRFFKIEDEKLISAKFDNSKINASNFSSQGHLDSIFFIHEFLDQSRLISISSDSLYCWELNQNSQLSREKIIFYPKRIVGAGYFPSNENILIASNHRDIFEYDLRTGKIRRILKEVRAIFKMFTFRSDGKYVLGYSICEKYNHNIVEYDLETGKVSKSTVFSRDQFSGKLITTLEYYIEEQSIVIVGCSDGSIMLISLEDHSTIFEGIYEKEEIRGLQIKKREDEFSIAYFSGELVTILRGTKNKILNGKTFKVDRNKFYTITSLAFNNEWTNFVVGTSEGIILEIEMNTLNRIAQYTYHLNSINFVKYSLNGFKILSGDDTGVIKLWERKDGSHIRTLGTEKFPLSSHYAAKDNYAFYSTEKGKLVRWDLITQERKQWNVYNCDITSINISPIYDFILVGFKDGVIMQYSTDLDKGNYFRHENNFEHLSKIFFDKEGKKLCAYSFEREFAVWDLNQNELICWGRADKNDTTLCFDTEGENLIANYHQMNFGADSDEQLRFFSLSEKQWNRTKYYNDRYGYKFLFSQDGSKILAIGTNELIEISTNDSKILRTIPLKEELNVNLIRYNSDSSKICGVSDNNGIYIYDVENKIQIGYHKCTDTITDVHLTNDDHIIVLLKSNQIISYEVRGFCKKQSKKFPKFEIEDICILPDEQSVIIAYGIERINKFLKWDYFSGEIIYKTKIDKNFLFFSEHSSITTVEAPRTGGRFYTLFIDGMIVEWDVKTGMLKNVLSEGKLESVEMISFSSEGKSVLVKYEKSDIFKEFDAKTGKLLGSQKRGYFSSSDLIFDKKTSKKRYFTKSLFKKGSLKDWIYYELPYRYRNGIHVKGCNFKNLHKESKIDPEWIETMYLRGAKVHIKKLRLIKTLQVLSYPLFLLSIVIMWIPDRFKMGRQIDEIFQRMRQNPFHLKNNAIEKS